MMTATAIATVFTPSLFRTPRDWNRAIADVFHNAKREQKFVLNLLECLDVSKLVDEDDWIPMHARGNLSISSSSDGVFSETSDQSFGSESDVGNTTVSTFTNDSGFVGQTTTVTIDEQQDIKQTRDSSESSTPSSTSTASSTPATNERSMFLNRSYVKSHQNGNPHEDATLVEGGVSTRDGQRKNSKDLSSDAAARSSSDLSRKTTKQPVQLMSPIPTFQNPVIIVNEAD